MKKIIVMAVSIVIGLCASASFAGSSFQNTCSNIEFAYVNNAATLKATCLQANGSANSTSLEIKGISKNSSFQARQGARKKF